MATHFPAAKSIKLTACLQPPNAAKFSFYIQTTDGDDN
jgi:hypothetical protein